MLRGRCLLLEPTLCACAALLPSLLAYDLPWLPAFDSPCYVLNTASQKKQKAGDVLATLNDTLFMSRHQIPQWQCV